MAMFLRRRETKHLLQLRQEGSARLLGNPDGAVALDVGVTAQRTDPGAGFADIPAHQQQVGDQPHI